MTVLTVRELTDLGTIEAPSPALVEALEMARREDVAVVGHPDFAFKPASLVGRYADQTRERSVLTIAEAGGRPVGMAQLALPDVDNTHLAEWEPRTDPDPDHEPGPVLDALWADAEARLRADGRTAVVVWQHAPLVAEPGTGLRPSTGSGEVARTLAGDWFAARGFELVQAEVPSALDMPVAPSLLDLLETAAAAASEAYEIVQWVGVTPPELRDAMATLRARMSVDIPQEGLAFEPEIWDADRVRAEDELVIAMGRTALWTAAIDRGSGVAAAYTCLVRPDDLRTVAFQEDTLVHGEHRGRRLGLRVKIANLRLLAERCPEVRRVHTFNADENSWMRAINQALGFRPMSTMGCWQLRMEGR